MKSIFVLTDLEGVAGVTSFTDDAAATGRYYDHAKKLLTDEINAMAEALVQEGVEDIYVCDGHGAGGVWYDTIHPQVKLVHGRPTTLRALFQPVERVEVVAILGQHAMAGVATSNMSHTQNSSAIDYMKLNGRLIGEIAQFALYAGLMGRPCIFLTGEKDACIEAEDTVPGITTMAVKEGLARGTAISLSREKAHQVIREGVAQAVRKHREQPIQPLVWAGPYVMETRYYRTEQADSAFVPGRTTRVDGQTIRKESANLLDVLY
jgi:D-amino peptidase